MKSVIKNQKLAIVVVTMLFITSLNSCTKNDSSSSGSSPTTPDFCTNGKQDNGETGVDCGGACTSCSNAFNYTMPFYIQFRENGNYTYFQDSAPQYNSWQTGDTVFQRTDFSPGFNATHGMELKFKDPVTSLVGKTLSFNYNMFPAAKLVFYDASGNEKYSSANVNDQTGSNCYVEAVNVLATDSAFGFIHHLYSVKGNFNCKISDPTQSTVKTLNYGKFSLRVYR